MEPTIINQPLQREEYSGITHGPTQRRARSRDNAGVIAPLCDGPDTAMIEQIIVDLAIFGAVLCHDVDMYHNPNLYEDPPFLQ